MLRLIKIQSELKAPKGQYNSFGKYKYRSVEDIMEAVKPLLEETKTAIILTDKIELIGERYYVKSTASLVGDNGKLIMAVDWFAREEESKKGMDWSQVTGASSSYARKYALNGLLAIDDTKDADATNEHKEEKKVFTEERFEKLKQYAFDNPEANIKSMVDKVLKEETVSKELKEKLVLFITPKKDGQNTTVNW